MSRGQRIWPPVFRLADLPDRALLHARLVPSAGDRYPDDPELSDAMDARFADIDSGKPSGAARGGEAVSAHAADASRVHAAASGALVRRLTTEGLRRAREFLADMREHPTAPREPPRDLLYDERYSRPFEPEVWIERRPFRTRREAAEYLAPKLAPIRHLVADHASVWSWLGMFYFADTVRVEDGKVRLSPLDETFVVHREDSRSFMLRFRHYLWGSWRLNEAHGEDAAFLLDQDLTSFGDIAQRTFGAIRVFNSAGIVPLILRLYTKKRSTEAGYSGTAQVAYGICCASSTSSNAPTTSTACRPRRCCACCRRSSNAGPTDDVCEAMDSAMPLRTPSHTLLTTQRPGGSPRP